MQLDRDIEITEAFPALQPLDDNFVLTKSGGIIAAIEYEGIDFDALTRADLLGLAVLNKSIAELMPSGSSVTHYYVHVDNQTINLKDRGDTISGDLSRGRAEELSQRGIARSKIIQVYHFTDQRAASSSFFKDVIGNIPYAIFDKQARQRIRERMKHSGSLILNERLLLRLMKESRKTLNSLQSHWSKAADAKILSLDELWQVMRFAASFNPDDLFEQRKAPSEDMDLGLIPGEIEQVQLGYMPVLKINSSKPRFVRIGSVTSFAREPIGYLTNGMNPPLSIPGTYVLVSHFAPLDELGRFQEFSASKLKMQRGRINITRMLSGETVETQDDNRMRFRRELEMYEKAEASDDRWGKAFNAIVVPGTSAKVIEETSGALFDSFISRGVNLVWENAGLPFSYTSLQPGGADTSMRMATVTSTRSGLTAPVFRSREGQPIVADLNGEEALFAFETTTGEPFHYSGYVGGRNFTIAVGPVRSGKTFFKNTMDTHWMKYTDSVARVVDIDPGSKYVASAFGDEGGYIEIGEEGQLNPFSVVSHLDKADQNAGFRAHLTALLSLMLESNDSEDNKKLTQSQQTDLDKSINATLRLPPQKRNLMTLFEHMGRETRAKFERWNRDGLYGEIFTGLEDTVSASDTRLSVWNLGKFRESRAAIRPLMLHMFYRIETEFENKATRSNPKLMEIDEAHFALSIPEFRNFITTKVRTWGKWGAGVSLWSQSAREYANTPDWDAIRSAASTFIFMADATMTDDVYRDAFKLTEGDLNVIRSLEPRKEAFIVQPEIGVRKRVILRVSPLQYAINTSHPAEAAIREQLIAQHGPHRGIQLAAEAFASNDVSQPTVLAAE